MLEKRFPHSPVCVNQSSSAVKRHSDQGKSCRRMHLIGGLLNSFIIMAQSMAACRQVQEQYLMVLWIGRYREIQGTTWVFETSETYFLQQGHTS